MKDKSNQASEENEQQEEEMLTPWQKENLKYLEDSGGSPSWKNEKPQEPIVKVEKAQEKVVEETSKIKKGASQKVEVESEPVSLEAVKDLPKSLSFADKLPKMKVARQKRLKKRLTLIISVFGMAALGMIYYVSPLSNLNEIEVIGNQVVSKEAIAKATKLTREDRIWSAYLNTETIPNIKKVSPRIKKVSVKLSKLNNLQLIVEEYSEVAYIKQQEAFYPVLESGAILSEPTEATNQDFLILVGFQEGASLDQLMAHVSELDPEVKGLIKEIHSSPSKYNEFLMTLFMKDENQVKASTTDFYKQLNYYPKMIADVTAKGVIDMEAGAFFTSYEEIEKLKQAEQAEKERQDWLKQLEEENKEKNNE